MLRFSNRSWHCVVAAAAIAWMGTNLEAGGMNPFSQAQTAVKKAGGSVSNAGKQTTQKANQAVNGAARAERKTREIVQKKSQPIGKSAQRAGKHIGNTAQKVSNQARNTKESPYGNSVARVDAPNGGTVGFDIPMDMEGRKVRITMWVIVSQGEPRIGVGEGPNHSIDSSAEGKTILSTESGLAKAGYSPSQIEAMRKANGGSLPEVREISIETRIPSDGKGYGGTNSTHDSQSWIDGRGAIYFRGHFQRGSCSRLKRDTDGKQRLRSQKNRSQMANTIARAMQISNMQNLSMRERVVEPTRGRFD